MNIAFPKETNSALPAHVVLKQQIMEYLDGGSASARMIADALKVQMALVLRLVQEPDTTLVCSACYGMGAREEKTHSGALVVVQCRACRGEGWR